MNTTYQQRNNASYRKKWDWKQAFVGEVVKPPKRFLWVKRLFAWILISLLWQIPIYYYLNQRVQSVIQPDLKTNITLLQSNNFMLSGITVEQPQISSDESLLAFKDGTGIAIYDLAQKKIIWQKTYPSGKILAYQWLPDRNTLLLFVSGIGVDPSNPSLDAVGIHSVDVSSTKDIQDRLADSLPSYLRDAHISGIALSTATNLLYFCVQESNRSLLYQIGVMKNLNLLNRSGESIKNLAISPTQGSVYYNSKLDGVEQVVAKNSNTKVQVASNPQDIVLGVWNQKLYLGTVASGYLTKVWTTPDNQPSSQRPNFTLFWEGNVPWNSSSKATIANYDLLVASESSLYKLSSQGTQKLANTSQIIFSPTENYYWQYQVGSSGTKLEKTKLS